MTGWVTAWLGARTSCLPPGPGHPIPARVSRGTGAQRTLLPSGKSVLTTGGAGSPVCKSPATAAHACRCFYGFYGLPRRDTGTPQHAGHHPRIGTRFCFRPRELCALCAPAALRRAPHGPGEQLSTHPPCMCPSAANPKCTSSYRTSSAA